MGWREEARRGTRILPWTRRKPTRARGGDPGDPERGARENPGWEHPERESRRETRWGNPEGGSGADPGEAHEWGHTISKLMLGQWRQTS